MIQRRFPSLPEFQRPAIFRPCGGTIDGEPFFFMVAHWPSRLGGKDASEFSCIAVGEQMRRIADSVHEGQPATKIVAMGDFNDIRLIRACSKDWVPSPSTKELQPGDFSSPFHAVLRAGMGTLAYGDALESLRQYRSVGKPVVNAKPGELASGAGSGIEVLRECVFGCNYMIQREGQFKGYPFAHVHVGNNFQGGYSDHFPVYGSHIGKINTLT